MKKLLFFTFALIGISVMSSCESTPRVDHIVIGNPSGMKVSNCDTMDDLYKQFDHCDYWFYTIDINQDGIEDIELYSADVYELDPSDNHFVSGITCLNENILLCCKNVEYTEYVSTIYEEDDSTNSIVRIHHVGNSYKPSEIDSIRGKYEILLPDFDKKQLCVNDFFCSYDQIFFDSGMVERDTLTIQGIEYCVTDFYSQDQYGFNMDSVKYIGLKFTENNNEKLGWLKFSMGPPEYFYRVELLEIALQE